MADATQSKRLYKNPDDKKIAGVCSGVAEYFDIDVVLVRVVWAVSVIVGGFGLWVYLILWLALDDKPAAPPEDVTGDVAPESTPGEDSDAAGGDHPA